MPDRTAVKSRLRALNLDPNDFDAQPVEGGFVAVPKAPATDAPARPDLPDVRDLYRTGGMEALYKAIKPLGAADLRAIVADQRLAPAKKTASRDALLKHVQSAVRDDVGQRGDWVGALQKQRRTDNLDADLIDDAAHEAATSPTNNLPEPTQAQKEAGNYKLGHLTVGGLDISVENPQGSERKGVDRSGKPWSVKMNHHYGYIRGTVGRDKDHVDVFVKPGTTELADDAPVFVIDQKDPQTGRFDEHKVMLGYDDRSLAEDAYRSNYTKDWKGLGAITQMPLSKFREWVRDSQNTSKPAAPKPRRPAPVPSTDPSPSR